MPKFAANLTMLYSEYAFLERFAAARADGFEAVEFLFPYAFPKEQVAERLRKHGLKQVLHNLPAGNWDAGERGIACLPGRTGEFQDGVGRAIEYATALACPQVNCLTGISPADADADRVHATLVDNLKFAAKRLDTAGIRLLVEPINDKDIPGFWLKHRIAHIQVADNPGRNEPGTGEINYSFLFAELDREGYAGWIGCEYRPRATTSEGLGWAAAYLRRSPDPRRQALGT